MTQIDYDQQKRECWEEYVNLLNHNSAARYVFDKIFDRAYALGKQTETISREDVEKGVREAVRKEYLCEKCEWKNDCDLCGGENTAFDCCECPADSYEDGFKAGANFALGKQEKDADTVIQGWVCRDKKDNALNLHAEKPYRAQSGYDVYDEPDWWESDCASFLPLDKSLFPDLIWSDEPLEVEIILKRKKK